MTRPLSTVAALVIALIAPAALAFGGDTGPVRITEPLSVEPGAETDERGRAVDPSSPAVEPEPESEPTPEPGPEPAPVPLSEPAGDAPVERPVAESTDDRPAVASIEADTEPARAEDADAVPAGSGTPLPATERLPLGHPGSSVIGATGSPGAGAPRFGGIMRTVGATAAVITLILLLRLMFVKLSGTTGGLRAQLGPAGKAPSGVLFVLGRYPVSRGMSLVLLQLDQRVLLLSQTSAGFHTLAELDDADEVASIIRKVRDESGESMSAKFTGMLRKFESDPQTVDELDSAATAQPVRLRRPADEYAADDGRVPGYYEAKPDRAASTGEDELRSRINRMREYGA